MSLVCSAQHALGTEMKHSAFTSIHDTSMQCTAAMPKVALITSVQHNKLRVQSSASKLVTGYTTGSMTLSMR